MTSIYPKYKNILGMLLIAVTLSGLSVLGIAASPAQAYQKFYSCTSCSAENGPEFETSAEGGIGMTASGWNLSGKGVCAAIWENLGGGKWKEESACTATESAVDVKNLRYFKGHGQVRRYYKEFLYNLEGEESN